MSSLDVRIASLADPPALEVSESLGTVVIRLRGSLDADAAGTVRRLVVSLAERPEITAVEVDLRDMDGWTPAGLRELGACATGSVRFRMGPRALVV